VDFLNTPLMLAVVCAYTYYVLGKYEAEQGGRNNGLLWAGLSVGVSFVVAYLCKGGWGVLLLAQVGLFAGITIFRAMRES
jgi:hypothetical protein